MDEQKYNKKKLSVLRIVLIVLGAAIGFSALWQYFSVFPDLVNPAYKIAISVVSSAAAATLLGLSAKPCYNLFGGVIDRIYAAVGSLGVRGAIVGVIGLVAAGIAAFTVDIIIRNVQNIWAVRLISDALVFMVFGAICCIGFTKWLDASETDSGVAPKNNGYLMSYDCFKSKRALIAARVVIGAKVLDGAYKALLMSDGDNAEAAARLNDINACGTAKIVKCGKEFSSLDEFERIEREFAERKRLRLISSAVDADVPLGAFSLPDEE